MQWQVELLGGLRLRQGSQVVERFRMRRVGDLLALLALTPGRRWTRESLAPRLWPDAPEEVGRHNLRQTLSYLRRVLEPAPVAPGSLLVSEGNQLWLNPQQVQSDLAQLDGALRSLPQRRPHSPEHQEALETIDQLYQGELLPDSYDDWVLPERDSRREATRRARLQLSQLYRERGDTDRALAAAERALTCDPLSEESFSHLLTLLLEQGNRAEAQRRREHFQERFVRQLGTEPTLTPAPQPPTPRAPLALPAPLTRFFGREQECAHLLALLDTPQVRLISLLGTGGAGKTRLALEVGRQTRRTPVYYTALAEVTDREHLLALIAEAVGARWGERENPLRALIAHLRQQEGTPLLILDNFEQVVEAGAPLIGQLLEAVGGLTCLVTTRRRLLLPGEREVPIAPLAVPTAPGTPERLLEFPAIQLFQDRAQGVRFDFQLTPQNAPSILALCSRLDGIPLALELAAVRCRTLTPTQILEALDSSASPLSVLSRPDRHGPKRHHTLRETIAWSYERLEAPLQQLWGRLSLFRGGFSAPAAEAICGATPESLATLEEHSLLQTQESTTTIRFFLLDTLRSFASETIAPQERTALELRFAHHFLQLAESAAPERALPDYENLLAALTLFQSHGETQDALRLAVALAPLARRRGLFVSLQQALRELLSDETLPRLLRAQGWLAAGRLAFAPGDLEGALAYLETAASLLCREDPCGIAGQIHLWLGHTMRVRGENQQAVHHYTRAQYHFEVCGDALGMAQVFQGRSVSLFTQDRLEEAREYTQAALALYRKHDDTLGIAAVLNTLGSIFNLGGDPESALIAFQESIALKRKSGDRASLVKSLGNLGALLTTLGRYDEAEPLLRESLLLKREIGDTLGLAAALEAFAHLRAFQNQPRTAVVLHAVAQRIRHELGAPVVLGRWCQNYATTLTESLQTLGDETAHLRQKALLLTQDAAVEIALGNYSTLTPLLTLC